MADYSTYKAVSLRQYSGLISAQIINEVIEALVQQAYAIKELNDRLIWLERK